MARYFLASKSNKTPFLPTKEGRFVMYKKNTLPLGVIGMSGTI
jgi:hypothetical protein